MNQLLADLFFALPRTLTEPYVFGSICLALCWLGYFAAIRGPIARAVRRRCKPAFLETHLAHRWQRLFYTAARKKAGLDEGGLYLTNLLSFLMLAMTSIIHVVLVILHLQGISLAQQADKLLLTVTVGVTCILSLITQPASTVDRRTRWGFGRTGSIVHAILREIFIVAVLFLWLYDAWFFPALL